MRSNQHSMIYRLISGILALLLIVSLLPTGLIGEAFAQALSTFTVELVDEQGQKVNLPDGAKLTLTEVVTSASTTVEVKNAEAVFADFVTVSEETPASYKAKLTDAIGYEYSGEFYVTADMTSVRVTVNQLEKVTVMVKAAMPNGMATGNANVTYSGYTEGKAEYDAKDSVFKFEAYAGKEYTVTVAPAENQASIYAPRTSEAKTVAADENGMFDFGTVALKNQYALKIIGVANTADVVVSVDGQTLTEIPERITEGANLTVTITARDGYRFGSLTHNDQALPNVGNTKTQTIKVDQVTADQRINVSINAVNCVVTVQANNGGTVKVNDQTPNGQGQVNVRIDSDLKLTVTPDNGRQIKRVTVDGVEVSAAQGAKGEFQYDCGKILGNMAVNVEFETAVYTISTNAYGDNGAVVVDGETLNGVSTTRTHNTKATIRVQANAGYRIKTLTVNGEDLLNGDLPSSVTILNNQSVVKDYNIHVEFAPKEYTITFSVGNNGVVEYDDGESKGTVVNGAVSFQESKDPNKPTQVLVSAVADAGHRISEVDIVDGKDRINEKFQKNNEDTYDYTFTLDSAKETYAFTVVFAQERFFDVKATLINEDDGFYAGGEVTGLVKQQPYGESLVGDKAVVVTADQKNGYEIKEISVNGEVQVDAAGKQEYRVEIASLESDVNIEVKFGLRALEVQIAKAWVGADGGSLPEVSVNGELVFAGSTGKDKTSVKYGRTMQLKVSVNGDYANIRYVEVTDVLTNEVKTIDKTAFRREGSSYLADVTITAACKVTVYFDTVEINRNNDDPEADNGAYKLTFSKEPIRVKENDGTWVYIMSKDTKVSIAALKEGADQMYCMDITQKPYHGNEDKVADFSANSIHIQSIVLIGKDLMAVNYNVSIKLVFDGTAPTAPVVSKDVDGWTNAQDVKVTTSAEDLAAESDLTYSAGLDYIVWSQEALDEQSVLNSANRLSADNAFTHAIVNEFDGDYYYYAVDKVGNVSAPVTSLIRIERTKPVIESFAAETDENNIFESLANLLTFGLFFNEETTVRVTVTDANLSSDIAGVTLYADGQPLETKNAGELTSVRNEDGSYVVTADFVLKEKDFSAAKTIHAVALDNAGNSSEHSEEYEIQITTAKPEVTNELPNGVYEKVIGEGEDQTVQFWYGDDVIIPIIITERYLVNGANQTEKLSGLKVDSLKVTINGKEVQIPADSIVKPDGDKVVEMTVMVNTAWLTETPEDGRYEICVSISNRAGTENESEANTVIYIDRTLPQIIGVELVQGANQKAHGWYSNQTVQVEVTAVDAFASAGLDFGQLCGMYDVKASEPDENGTYVLTFEVPSHLAENAVSMNQVLSAVVTDNVGHTSELVYGENLMVETMKPVIKISSVKPVYSADGKDWYDGDVDLTIQVKDAESDSDIYSGVSQVKYCDMNAANAAEQNYSASYEMKEREAVIVRNTGEMTYNKEDGSYILSVTATDNAGNEAVEQSKTIYKDLNDPTISRFTFAPVNTLGFNPEDNTDQDFVAYRTYGFWFKEATNVTIYAEDAAPSAGIREITYRLVDSEGKLTKTDTVTVDDDNCITVRVEAGFKGQIYAYATDNVDRYSRNAEGAQMEYQPDGIILETQDMHDKETHISFEKAPAVCKDTEGRDLYDNDVPVLLTITDDFSGIEMIEWIIKAPNAESQSGSLEIDDDGCVDAGSGWSLGETDNNLVTRISRTFTVTQNSNNIVFTVKMTDKSGNTTEQSINFSIDKTDPVIKVTYSGDDADSEYTSFYNGDRVMHISIQERNFSRDRFEAALSNTDKVIPEIVWGNTEVSSEHPDYNVHHATITFHADGDYSTTLNCTDLAGRKAATVGPVEFTVDQTKPTVSVRYSDVSDAVNGNYYRGQRVATITIVEHNFDSKRVRINGSATNDGASVSFPATSSWKSKGNNTYTATITYSADAHYTFDIEYMDKAGNSINDFEKQAFVVDNVDPEILITGVEHLSANNGTVAPVIECTDTNYDKAVAELIGINNGAVDYERTVIEIHNGQTFSYADFLHEQSVDDIYILRVTVTDKSGRTSTKEIIFSANRFGSVYDLSQLKDINGKYVQQEQDLVFYEINVDELIHDTIRIKLTASGEAKELVKDVDYTVKQVAGSDESWYRYEYVILAKHFANDGTYSVAVYSVDEADNINENIDERKQADITFGVDKTLPVVVVSGLESDEQYNEENKTVIVDIKDNMVLDHVVIELNGEPVEYTVDELGQTYSFTIPERSEVQSVKIIAVDASGNEQVVFVDNVTVSTNAFVRWFNNKPLFYGTLGGVAFLGLGIFFFLLIGKKKKEEEAE